MPPKAKFTKEQVVSSAFDIVATEGKEALTARSLADALGCSPRPIFTLFDSMDEVFDCVLQKAKACYAQFVDDGLKEDIAFKGVGKAYIRFATKYPKLFRLLFMCENISDPHTDAVLQGLDDNYDRILGSIESGYGLSRETARELYLHLWIYSHGIAVLIATGVCAFTQEQVEGMLTEVFVGLLKKIIEEGKR